MKNQKLIFIHEGAITNTIVRMYILDKLISYGFDIELWSLRFLRVLWNELPGEIDYDNYYRLESFREFKEKIRDQDRFHTVVISSISDTFANRHVNFLLHKERYVFVYINPYNDVIVGKGYTMRERIQLAFSSNILRKLFPEIKKILHNRILKPLHHLNFDKHIIACREPRILAINSSEYEAYLALKSKPEKEFHEKYMLFIDIGYPTHPDMPYFYGIRDLDEKPYLYAMNKFFDLIEKKYKLPVVIALHPKSTYSSEDFGGRHTLRYKTHALIKDAEAILTHFSSSTTLAVLYNKPTLFFYPRYMMEKTSKAVTKLIWYAESFGKKAVIIDDVKEESIEITPFAEEYRRAYIYSIMTTKEHENLTNSEIMIPFIEDIFDKLEKGIEMSLNS